jgi:hypothetical protein
VADDLYDEVTRRRIDGAGAARRGVRRGRASGPRRALSGGALLTAVALGLQEVLEPQKVKVVIEEVRSDDEPFLPPVSLLLVPDAPRLSRALVRPWLL